MESPGPQPPPSPLAGPTGSPAPAAAAIPIEYLDIRRTPTVGSINKTLRSPWFWPVSAISYVIIGCVLVGGFTYGIAAAVGVSSVMGWVSLIGLLVLTATARLSRGIRRNRARIVLGYLEQAARLNLPLPAMLRAAEAAEAAGARRAIRRLRVRLEDGLPVARALDEAVSGASTRTIGLVDAAERTGRLGAALRRLTERDRSSPPRDPARAIFLRWYPLVLTLGIGVVCLAIPKFLQILADFHWPIPPVMRWLADWNDTIFFVAAIVIPAAVLIFIGRMTAAIFAPRLPRPAVLGRLIDPVLWNLPLVGGVVRGRGLADICNVLADALESGHTPTVALANVKELKLNTVLRRRAGRWAERVEGGVPFADAARAARMPGLLVGMLSSAAGEDVPRVLRFLARYYQSRFSRAAELLRGAIIPGMVVGFGAIVLTVACAMLVPLIDLVNAMCSRLNQGRL